MNWRALEADGGGALIFPSHLEGWIWGENIGWISLGAGTGPHTNANHASYGVNVESDGALSGFAWGENIGWVWFGVFPALKALGVHARLDADRLQGAAWGEGIGWLSLGDSTHYVGLLCPDFCDDGDPCTQDTCIDGEGCAHEPVDCDDGIPCTFDECTTAVGCVHVGVHAICEDGNPCTTNTCLPGWGCTSGFNAHPCDDGDACTGSDACSAGTCAGAPLDCDDGSACTWDVCDSAVGCLALAVDAPAEPCNGADDDCDGTVDEACVWFVDAASTATAPDGRSWESAFAAVASAVAAAKAGDEVWVRAGSYTAVVAAAPVANIPAGVTVRGGFAGGEAFAEQRPSEGAPSVLSGDRDGSHTATAGDSVHVVVVGNDVVLERLSIERGAALGLSTAAMGGGVYGVKATGVILRECTFSQNMAQIGGAVHVQALSGAAFSLTVERCAFSGNAATVYGGAISAESLGSLRVFDSVFDGNDGGAHGGAISATVIGPVEIRRTRFAQNHASTKAGAVRLEEAATIASISDCSFEQNYGAQSGAGLWVRKSPLTLERTSFIANASQGVAGGMYVQEASPTIVDCWFEANTAGDDAGGLRVSTVPVVLKRTSFVGNTSGGGGGGAFIEGHPSQLSAIERCHFEANSAQHDGGGLLLGNGAFEVQRVVLLGNAAALAGGAVTGYGPAGIFDRVHVLSNTAGTSGGGLRITGSAGWELRNSRVQGNTAGEDGGALSLTANATIRLLNSSFVGNSASDQGGTLYSIGSDTHVDLCSIAESTSEKSTAESGAVLYTSNSGSKHTRIRNSVIFPGLGASGALFAGAGINKVPLVDWSCIQGGYAGTGNITLSPAGPPPWSTAEPDRLLLDPASGASCLNAGHDALADATGLDWTALTVVPSEALDSPPVDLGRHYEVTSCAGVPDGTLCDDENPCTAGDSCAAGACVGGAAPCDDGNPCTVDVCDPQGACGALAVPGPCDDGNACTWGEACQGGACLGGYPVACDDGDPCTLQACTPAEGCTFAADPACGCPGSGDTTADGGISITDVQCIILVSLWALASSGNPAPVCANDLEAADINCDGTTAIADVQLAIALTLGVGFDPSIDANGDDCVDACSQP